MQYKESRYNHSGMLDGKVFLYNLVTSSIALLNGEEYEQIRSGHIDDPTFKDTAVANGFVVPLSENEVEKVLAIQRMNNYSSRFVGFQILPTTACNARCFYCYEQDYSPMRMTQDVADAIPSFLENYLDMVDDIHITWFGGEPLLEPDRIFELSGKMIRLAESHGVGYSSDIITNASLADSGLVAKLVKESHISQVQVTLDGMGAEHLRRKAYVTDNVSFDATLDAMDSFVEFGAKLLIRLNVDKNNLDDCLRLIPALGNRYRGLDSVMLYAAPIYGKDDASQFCTAEELNAAYKSVFRAMIDAGFIQSMDGLPLNFNNATCSARMINNLVIAPNGDIFKCEHLLSYGEERVGSVFDGVLFNDAMAKWCAPDIPAKCMECSFLPSCQAGCYAAEALDFGLRRCPHISYITEAIVDAAGYLMGINSH